MAQTLTPNHYEANDTVVILSHNTLYILLPNVDMPLDKYSLTTITNYWSLLMTIGY